MPQTTFEMSKDEMDVIKYIKLRAITKKRLDVLGRKGESYDSVINKILDDFVYNKRRKPKQEAML